MKSLSRCLLAATICLALASYAGAQITTETDHKKPHTEKMATLAHTGAKPVAKLHKAVLQEVLDAWCSLKPENAAKFYGKGPEHVFYDLAPLKYNGWAEYEKGATQLLSDFKSAKCKVNDDAQIHNAGDWAWATATAQMDFVAKDGQPQSFEVRWTTIWHNHGGANWLIAHEHVSVPMQEPEKK